jgi:hypothetical protein
LYQNRERYGKDKRKNVLTGRFTRFDIKKAEGRRQVLLLSA